MAPSKNPTEPGKDKALAQVPPSAESALAAIYQGQVAESGFEEMASSDFVMPILKILNDLSPEVKATSAKYMPLAKVGQLLETSTGELMDSVEVIPCLYKAQMVEWKANRGGFVALHDADFGGRLPVNEKGQKIMPNGNVLIDTRYYYCLRIRGEELIPNIISLFSTAIKKAKELNTKLETQRIVPPTGGKPFRPPMFLNVLKISTVQETKGQNTWFGWKFDLARLIGPKEAALLQKAQDARTIFQESAGKMKPVEDDSVPVGDENPHL